MENEKSDCLNFPNSLWPKRYDDLPRLSILHKKSGKPNAAPQDCSFRFHLILGHFAIGSGAWGIYGFPAEDTQKAFSLNHIWRCARRKDAGLRSLKHCAF
jgi:hypothetical protein